MGDWYYYSGAVPRAVQVAPGRSVAVRRHSKVEIQVLTPEAAALVASGALVRTGRPAGAVPAAPAAPVTREAIAAAVAPPEWVRQTVDQGTAATPALAPPVPREAKQADAGAEGAADEGGKRKGKRR